MTGIEVARSVVETKQAHLFRLRSDAQVAPYHYDARPYGAGAKRGWIVLDLYSASAIVKVWENINVYNREKFSKIFLTKMAEIAFQLMK